MPRFQPLNPLETLRARLREAMDVRSTVHAVEWGNPKAMAEARKQIQRDLGNELGAPPTEDQLVTALRRFARELTPASFSDFKYVCYGTTVPLGPEGWRLIDRRMLFEAVLTQTKQRSGQAKQFRRCYQGLLSSYFGFERNLESPSDADARWLTLRNYLADQLVPVRDASLKRGAMPEWLNTLQEHKNLLTSDPCSRYAAGLVRDDHSELKQACTGLGISANSWVWHEALMSYVKLVCQSADVTFKRRMEAVLDLINGRASLRLPPRLAAQATALLVTRYAQCAAHAEHAVLRDTCVEHIGNPWLRRTAWDALVNHEPARLMVNSWLKQRLIKDFFELLAADGAADLRRLHYWLKWEPDITDMWFVLGSNAQDNRSPEFKEVRSRMAGRDRRLQDPNPLNNAFVMRIGPLLVIEFGLTGNACFVFAASDFKADLNRPVLKTNYELKQYGSLAKLTHQRAWEGKFDYELKKLRQSVPWSKGQLREFDTEQVMAAPRERVPPPPVRTTALEGPAVAAPVVAPTPVAAPFPAAAPAPVARPAPVAATPTALPSRRSSAKSKISEEEFGQLQILCARSGVEWMDNRPKGGALWVMLADRSDLPHVAAVLDLYRFKFKEGTGFWLKEDT